jgi:hypothetical protein
MEQRSAYGNEDQNRVDDEELGHSALCMFGAEHNRA